MFPFLGCICIFRRFHFPSQAISQRKKMWYLFSLKNIKSKTQHPPPQPWNELLLCHLGGSEMLGPRVPTCRSLRHVTWDFRVKILELQGEKPKQTSFNYCSSWPQAKKGWGTILRDTEDNYLNVFDERKASMHNSLSYFLLQLWKMLEAVSPRLALLQTRAAGSLPRRGWGWDFGEQHLESFFFPLDKWKPHV